MQSTIKHTTHKSLENHLIHTAINEELLSQYDAQQKIIDEAIKLQKVILIKNYIQSEGLGNELN